MGLKRLLVAAGVIAALAIASGTASTGPATAAPGTIYCVNGVSTTLPVGISASSVNHGDVTNAFTVDNAAYVLGTNSTGRFYMGYDPNFEPVPGWYFVAGEGPENLEPGYSTNYVSLGACHGAVAASVPSHIGVCKYLKRGDGTMGRFQEITVATWNDKNGQYFDAPAANWVEGVGLTCDNPLSHGYKAAGYNVAWGGKPDPGSDPHGVRGSGMNDIYPYFTK